MRRSTAILCSGGLAFGSWLWFGAGESRQAPEDATRAADSTLSQHVAATFDAGKEPIAVAAPGSAAETAVDARTRHLDWLNDNLARQRAALSDLHMRGELKARHRLMLVQTHPALAEFMGLSADEADRLFDVLAEQQLRQLDANDSTWINGKLNDDALAEVHRNAELQSASNEAELAQLLGAERYERYRAYMSPTGQMRTIRDIGAALQVHHLPLDQQQASQMLGLLEVVPQASDSNATTAAGIEQELQRLGHVKERSLQMLAPILTEQQLEIVRQVQDQRTAGYRANLELLKRQASPVATNPAPASQDSVTGFMESGSP